MKDAQVYTVDFATLRFLRAYLLGRVDQGNARNEFADANVCWVLLKALPELVKNQEKT